MYIYNVVIMDCMKKHMDTRESGTRKSPTKSKGGGRRTLGSEEEKNPRLVPREIIVKSP